MTKGKTTMLKTKTLLNVGLAVALVLAFGTGTASAQAPLDPSTLHVAGSSSQGTDPVQIGNNGTVIISEQSNGMQASNLNPVLLIVGVANDSTGTALSTSSITSVTNSAGGTTSWALGGIVFGQTFSTSGASKFMTGPGNGNTDVYSTLGLSGEANHSNNFSNWSSFDKTINGITVNNTPGFGLYVFVLNVSSDLVDQGSLTVQFGTTAMPTLPAGSYVVAWSNTASDGNGTTFDTPFTHAGLETTFSLPTASTSASTTTLSTGVVPAPAAIVLWAIGGGLASVGVMIKRRPWKKRAA
jgi:hypothetical protein